MTTPTPSTPASSDDAVRAFRVPAVDIFENDDEFLLVTDLPGVEQEAVELELEQGELTLFARREVPREGDSLALHRTLGDFRRVFRIPDRVDATRVQAQLDDGVLKIHLPKAEQLKPRRIAVTAS
ncbi:MAG: Hsp20/alpha crystallin family protein [Deltaproteobacteria bacterium]|nr:Hsp20/alpha crystallin family protein [Deltaproteobacteria bacterium]